MLEYGHFYIFDEVPKKFILLCCIKRKAFLPFQRINIASVTIEVALDYSCHTHHSSGNYSIYRICRYQRAS